MKKLSISILALAGFMVAAPSFADDAAAPAGHHHHRGHHHKGKKKCKMMTDKKDGADQQKKQADDLNSASMQKAQSASEAKAPEMPANMPAPAGDAK